MREALSQKYIRGRGVEIGGLHYPLPVYNGAQVIYVDQAPLDELHKFHPDVKPVQNDILVDDAEELRHTPFDLDFLIANHVFEHCRNPLKTLIVWLNHLKPGGMIYAAIPERSQTFDKLRPNTPFGHLVRDAVMGPEVSDAEHYREYFTLVDAVPNLDAKVQECLAAKTNIHFHAWDKPTQIALMESLRPGLFDIVERGDHGAEIIWILRKL